MSISVRPVRRSGRNIEARWTDPATGRMRSVSTGTRVLREAERFCARLEKELSDRGGMLVRGCAWADFRERYAAEVLSAKAKRTGEKYATVFNQIERLLAPTRPGSVNGSALSAYAAARRREGIAEITIRDELVKVRGALKWARDMGMIDAVPPVRLPTRTARPKGRPLTAEEFERMLDRVPAVVGDDRAESWRHLLNGLWWGGLRLTEAVDLHWTDTTRTSVHLESHARPMLLIAPEADKKFRERLFPMAPEFAGFLQRTPPAERTGFVFDLRATDRWQGWGLERVTSPWASKLVARVGRAARIVTVDRGDRQKFASAQDLRRSFGFRWAMRIMPSALKELMRHDSITTTQQFYVGHEAEAVADVVWEAMGENAGRGDNFGDNGAGPGSR